MPSKTFVTPDVHGRPHLVEGLLREAGVLRPDGARDDSVESVQIGDLINAVLPDVEGDVECLCRARDWFDILLVGNHEYPYFGGSPFGGFYPDRQVAHHVHGLERDGFYRPCLYRYRMLISHAGLTREMAETVDASTSGYAETVVATAWQDNRLQPLFAQVGARRGGRSMHGGILWSDFHEPKAEWLEQLVGHTPQPDGPTWQDSNDRAHAVNIDVGQRGDRIVGAMLSDGAVEFVEYRTDVELLAA